jgi:hypothetical protein
METMRLRGIQQPGNVDRLLEAFICGTSRVPSSAYPVRTRSGLSQVLKSLVQQAQKKQQAWSAWSDDRLSWLFTAEMSLALSRERGMPVLEVRAYSDHGELQETGFWARDRQGCWHRCAD